MSFSSFDQPLSSPDPYLLGAQSRGGIPNSGSIHTRCQSFFGKNLLIRKGVFKGCFWNLSAFLDVKVNKPLFHHHYKRSKIQVGGCTRLLGLPPQRTTHWGDSNDRSVLSHGSGGWKSETKILTKLVPSEGRDRGSVPSLSLGFWGFVGNCWPSSACRYIPPISAFISHDALPVYVFPKFLFL